MSKRSDYNKKVNAIKGKSSITSGRQVKVKEQSSGYYLTWTRSRDFEIRALAAAFGPPRVNTTGVMGTLYWANDAQSDDVLGTF